MDNGRGLFCAFSYHVRACACTGDGAWVTWRNLGSQVAPIKVQESKKQRKQRHDVEDLPDLFWSLRLLMSCFYMFYQTLGFLVLCWEVEGATAESASSQRRDLTLEHFWRVGLSRLRFVRFSETASFWHDLQPSKEGFRAENLLSAFARRPPATDLPSGWKLWKLDCQYFVALWPSLAGIEPNEAAAQAILQALVTCHLWVTKLTQTAGIDCRDSRS